ncbi:DUF1292 domain-containing protein [Clostridium sp. CM028]|uniref:DUF1292 domain-containing protein n=1 Tax=Clostridium TaxID=1485 RepID=UPI0013EEA803|nr:MULTISPECIES: DUF1292 domain-containing protein [Clostridium]MBU3091496.1 DUF1292 domain-containing protein [Clostridium sp. CF011]MBW9144240.1 DUF1292 domain-containing protein [Clostridium sp. CM027]MBW9147450.1 DUF1292 domain-containing protein [Clostridium sp. CM028]MBZ9608446.1 DUF1292 domain-containing protein [Clostridium estertheticum]UVE41123.1 DUF1292 domain-containing protein [Clostridium sp. CM027]
MNEDKKTSCGCGCGDHEQDQENKGCGCGGHEHDENEGCGCGGHEHDENEGCGCGCGEGEALTVDLEDENGNIVPCEIVDGFTYKDNEFALVQNPEDDSIYLFKVIGDEETGELVIPEDEEFAEVTAYYEELIKSEK